MATWFTSSIRWGGSSGDWGNSRHRRGGMCCMQLRLAEFCISIYPTRTLKRWTLQSGLGRRFSKRLWLFLLSFLGSDVKSDVRTVPAAYRRKKKRSWNARRTGIWGNCWSVWSVRSHETPETWTLKGKPKVANTVRILVCMYTMPHNGWNMLKHVFYIYFCRDSLSSDIGYIIQAPADIPWQVSVVAAVRSNRGRRTSSWWNDVLHKRSRSEIQGHGSTFPQLFWLVLVQCLKRFKSSSSLSLSDTIWHNLSIFFHLFPYTMIYHGNTNASIDHMGMDQYL